MRCLKATRPARLLRARYIARGVGFLFLVTSTNLFAGDTSLTVAGLRIMPKAWDKQGNLEKFERYARQAAAGGAQLILAPEGFLEGYVGNTLDHRGVTREQYFAVGESIDGPMLGHVRDLARELKVYLGLGFAERRGAEMFNSFVAFSPEGTVAIHYSKVHNDDDEPYNTKGTEFPVVATPLGRWDGDAHHG